eukprot:jgi/Hompol1/5695/HPOL_004668-RA
MSRNPGIIDYYHDFLVSLHSLAGHGRLDIIGLSYPGHALSVPLPHGHPPLDLEQQVLHKVAFVDAVVAKYPPKTRIFLAGHSLGSYIVLQVLERRPESDIFKALALFPTLHSMADTPQGQIISILVMPGRWLAPIVESVTMHRDVHS